MPQILYYVPESAGKPDPSNLGQFGLGYAYDGGSFSMCHVQGGPDGGNGHICVLADMEQPVGYYKDKQEWTKIPGDTKGLYAGVFKNHRPRPADLVRKRIVQSRPVLLADGNEWLVPIARGWPIKDSESRASELPRYVYPDDKGNWVCGDVREEYRALFSDACRWYDFRCGAVDTFEGTISVALEALKTNYRVWLAEAKLLNMFDNTGMAQDVMDVLIDMPKILELIEDKKKAEQAMI